MKKKKGQVMSENSKLCARILLPTPDNHRGQCIDSWIHSFTSEFQLIFFYIYTHGKNETSFLLFIFLFFYYQGLNNNCVALSS